MIKLTKTETNAKFENSKVSLNRRSELTIKRPNGNIDIVVTKLKSITAPILEQIASDTRAANGSNVISAENFEERTWVPMTNHEINEQAYQAGYDQTVSMMAGGEYHS